MKKVIMTKNIIMATIVIIFLTWAFLKNEIVGKIIILPFLICALAILGGNISLLFKKDKLAKIFSMIFKISFGLYIFGILGYTIYYAFANKAYSLLIVVGIFILLIIFFFRNYRKK